MSDVSTDLTNPIAIVSVGRSGSTLLHRILGRNRHLAWLSVASERLPRHPSANRLVMSAIDLPVVGPFVQSRVHPLESYPFWDAHLPGFSQPARDIGADDLLVPSADRTRVALANSMTKQRVRMLLKVTGWPRVAFIDALLPGTQFVHIVRDPRAVVSSLLQVSWWDGFEGPSRWRYGPLSNSDQEQWNDLGQSWAALAAIQWRMQVRAAVDTLDRLTAERALLVRYEDLLAEPTAVLTRLSNDLSLEWDDHDRSVLGRGIRPDSNGWREALSSRDISDVGRITREHAELFGYEV